MSDNNNDLIPDDEVLRVEEVVEELNLPEPPEVVVESETESIVVGDFGAPPPPPPPPAPSAEAPTFAAPPPPAPYGAPPAPAGTYPPTPGQYAPPTTQEPVASTPPPAPYDAAPPPPVAPVAPVPPAPYGTPPAPAPAPAPVGQPQAVPAAATVPAGPSAFGMALGNLWYSMNDIWHGKIPAAFARPKAVEAETGTRWLNWFLPFLATSLAFGFTVASAMGRGVSGFNDLTYGWGLGGIYGPGFDFYFRVFLFTTIVAFALYILRALAVWLAALTSGIKTDFASSASTVGVAVNILWLPMLAATLLLWIFPATLMSALLSIGLLGLVLMVEITTYIGVTRLGRSVRSPLVPYTWYTVIAVLVTLLFASLLSPMIV